MGTSTNRLADQSSPYLLQHADNPVAWQPWDEEALELAKQQDKPIFLSIGYSTCHWCHVMAKESFADSDVAAVMNENFVCIKVDREERPDLDKIYQTCLQLITQQGGGWPLTMFLDPQTMVPFYGGTYFPKTASHQLPGLTDLLMRLSEIFAEQRDKINEQSGNLQRALDQLVVPLSDPVVDDLELLASARSALDQLYDKQHGGFGGVPKFPMPNAIERVLRHWAFTRRAGGNDKAGLDMVMTTLTQMARGGIYDHLGGGFCRYATDARWMIPHFEKMLYDNAQLLSLYSHALSFGADDLFQQAIEDTVSWLTREMRHPQGGFFAGLDADSEGEEGKFYVWRRDQAKKLLTEDEYLIIETLYGLDKPANFDNKWNLHRYDSWRSVVGRLSMQRPAADELLARAQSKLLEARSDRIRPGTDDKVLTAWNGLTIRGLAHASARLNRADWADLALDAAQFIRTQCWRDGVLYASWKDGKASFPGYLDDYANVLDGLLALMQVRWRDEDAQFAIALADALLENFYDADNGGFFFTSNDHEQLIQRPKPSIDDALPPGNATATSALLQLGHLLAETRYLDAAHNTLRWARAAMEKLPAGHCTLLNSLEETVYPPQQVVLRGPQGLMQEWLGQLDTGYAPWRSTFAIAYDGANVIPSYLPRLVSSDQQQKVTAYVCSGLQCSQPITNIDDLRSELE